VSVQNLQLKYYCSVYIRKVENRKKYIISGQLWKHLRTEIKNFQPMNANFGILPPLAEKIRDKKKKKSALIERALQALR